jgi:phosphohistidine phosphatase SixA
MKATWKNSKEAAAEIKGRVAFGKGSLLRKTFAFLPGGALFFLLLAVGSLSAADPPVLFIVRHAEKAATAGNDPDLSTAGRARAESLARMLKDARITAIYVTDTERTHQTAAPVARALGLQPTVVAASDTATLADKLKAQTGNALVVGHGNTIPDLLKALGLPDSISIGENDYDNFFIVIPGITPRLVRLHMP